MPTDQEKIDALVRKAVHQGQVTEMWPFISQADNRRALAIAMGISGGIEDAGGSGGIKAAMSLAQKGAKAVKAAVSRDPFGGIRPDSEVRGLWTAVQAVEKLAQQAGEAGFKMSSNDLSWIQTAKEAAMSHMTDPKWGTGAPGFQGQGKAPHDVIMKLQGILGTVEDTITRRLEAARELEGKFQSSRGIELPEEVGTVQPQPAPKAVSQPPAPQVASQPIEAPQGPFTPHSVDVSPSPVETLAAKPTVQHLPYQGPPRPEAPRIVENPRSVEVEPESGDEIGQLEKKLKSVAKDLSAEQKAKLAKWAKMTTRPSMKEHTQAIARILELQKNPTSEIPGEKDLLRLILRDTDYKI